MHIENLAGKFYDYTAKLSTEEIMSFGPSNIENLEALAKKIPIIATSDAMSFNALKPLALVFRLG